MEEEILDWFPSSFQVNNEENQRKMQQNAECGYLTSAFSVLQKYLHPLEDHQNRGTDNVFYVTNQHRIIK